MGLDYGFVVCAKCGKGYDFEQLAQNGAEQWKQIDLWSLENGKELQPYLRLMWIPICPECGGDKFYPMINSDEVAEYLEDMLQDGVMIGEAEQKLAQALLELWRHRLKQEDEEWQANAKKAKETETAQDCECGHQH